MSYIGQYDLNSTSVIPFTTTNASDAVVSPDATPLWRAFGASGPLDSSFGTAARYTVGGAITGVTTANPFVVTTTSVHGLQVGDVVVIAGVLGSTSVNGTRTISAVTATTFSVASAAGGTYTSGGTTAIDGLWKINLDASEANGYSDDNFSIIISYAVSAVQQKQTKYFTVG